MDSLLAALARWRPFTALVVGDFMLDQLVYGDAERLTADAPVPVLHARRTEEAPGGAANVCLDIAALGGRVRAFGVTGNDAESRVLLGELTDAGIDTAGVVRDPDRPTTVKRSLIGLAQHRHAQKMFRVDHESREPLDDEHVEQLLERFDAALPHADIVAIEDYRKGVCTPRICAAIIERCRAAGVEVIVDPAALDSFDTYAGATAITPNRTEAERASSRRTSDEPTAPGTLEIAEILLAQTSADTIVMTLDRHGALLAERGERPAHIPTRARQLYDVTGAGDMVLAGLLAARANGCGWRDAVRFANAAAGLEVEVFGVQPIPFERVRREILAEHFAEHDKLRDADQAEIEIASARRDGKRTVFTNGCFDILHAGHISLLREAKRFGDLLVVAINADASVTRLKGEGRPVHTERDRADVLGELRSVDIVVVFEEDTPEVLLERLRPDVLVKGGDYTKAEVVGGEFVEGYGGRVELVPTLEGRSTTGAIEKIRAH
ncbi:MAG: D-glycero-beta-D-manno-heptose 1-phosphate adenylyltransferase [Planctomycetota bacterium]